MRAAKKPLPEELLATFKCDAILDAIASDVKLNPRQAPSEEVF